MNRSTVGSTTFNGIPINTYNTVTNESKEFYISYNNYDKRIYGCDTTALVYGQMEKFYILNGNHTKEYAELFTKGFDACFKYFTENEDKKNKHSD
jgi:ABC-type xylose transport system substrate-binding protein